MGRTSAGRLGEAGLTLDLRLVHDEVSGSPTALKLLRAALLGAQLFVLSLVEGESRGGEPTVAGGAREGRQRVLLGTGWERKRKHVAEPLGWQTLSARQHPESLLHHSPQREGPQISLVNPTFTLLPHLGASRATVFSQHY